jgi:DNA-binding NtrC family response regulator
MTAKPEPVSILIVDDEPPLLRLMMAYLEKIGYAVAGCADATSALDLFAKEPGRFRIVIADLTLPDMQGDVMASRMIDGHPDLRVLLCSGYMYDLDSLPLERRPHFRTLQKPFLPNMLAKSVEELLASV